MFLTFAGMYLAVRNLSIVVYTLSTGVGGFLWSYVATHGTQKTLPRIIGRKEFENSSRWTSLQMDIYRGVLYGGLMCLTWIAAYYVTPILTPYVPGWLTAAVSFATSEANGGGQTIFLGFCIIFLFILLAIGVFSLRGGMDKENAKLRAENEKLRHRLRNHS